MADVLLLLGSNVGDRLRKLKNAVLALNALRSCRVLARSRVYETAPVGPAEFAFLNAAIAVTTVLPAHHVLERLLGVERTFGRERTVRWGPRSLDLDLLLVGDERHDAPGLTVPHPRLAERGFVLTPLADIAADVVVPGDDATVAQLLAAWRSADGAGISLYDKVTLL